MNEAVTLALAGVAGVCLGVLFYGGLWWTVRQGALSSRPAFWFFGSLLVRMGIVLTGFHLVGGGHWERLVACLLGFALARCLVTRLTGPPVQPNCSSERVAGHAP
jgi:F1F0 ATPase subunit 2